MAPLPAASPKWLHRNECISHILHSRSDARPRRLIPATAGHSSTSTSIILSCKRSRPYQQDPGSLPHHVPGCRLRPPEPGPPDLHAGPITCLDRFSISSCPFFSFSPPTLFHF